MHVRAANLGDVPRLVEMAAHFLAASIYGRRAPADPARLEQMVVVCLDHGLIVVAEDRGGHLVGMIGFLLLPYPLTGETFADEIAWWVEPAARKVETGRALVETALAQLPTHGAAFVKMAAPVDSLVGAFYETLGFVALETAYVKELR